MDNKLLEIYQFELKLAIKSKGFLFSFCLFVMHTINYVFIAH
jgi:hypothetical protein